MNAASMIRAVLLALVVGLGPAAGLARAAEPDTRVMDEDDGVVISVLENDPGSTTTSQIEPGSVTDPPHGTASIAEGDSDGVNYTPDHDYCNSPGGVPDTFQYTGVGLGTATVSVTVTCIDDPPVANDDLFMGVPEDSGAALYDVLANDTDVEGDPIRITKVSTPGRGGTASVVEGQGGGSDRISYKPKANVAGAENLVYTVNGGDTAVLTVDVSDARDLPVAVDDVRTVAFNGGTTFLDVLSNDFDPDDLNDAPDDRDPIPIIAVTQPLNGTTQIVQGGDRTDQIAYTPNRDFCGMDTFTYGVFRDEVPVARVMVTVPCPVRPSGGSAGGTIPVAQASAKAGKVKVSGTSLTVPLSCTKAASCVISLGLTAKQNVKAGRTRTVAIGKARVTLRAGQKRTVTVTLNKAGKRALKKSRTLKAKLKIVLGGKTLATRTVTFKVKRKR